MGLPVHKAVVLFTLLIVYANSQIKFQVSGLGDERNLKIEAFEESDNVLYQPQVIIEPPGCSVDTSSSCNCTKIQELMSAELQATNRQLQQLQSAVSDIAELLTKFSVSPPTQQAPLTTASVSPPTQQAPLTTASVSPPTQQAPLTTASVSYPEDCTKLLSRSDGALESGVYRVQPLDDGPPVSVYCDMETDGGGWTVFQRRQDGSIAFYRTLVEYRRGFGNPNGEFWLGNDNLHRLTAQGVYELRVDLEDYQGNTTYAVYGTFRIGALKDGYRLELGNYTGSAGDSMSYSNKRQFTTGEMLGNGNCALHAQGAWWFNYCFEAHLNGEYGATQHGRGILWKTWKGYDESLKGSEMKIRQKY